MDGWMDGWIHTYIHAYIQTYIEMHTRHVSPNSYSHVSYCPFIVLCWRSGLTALPSLEIEDVGAS